MAFVLLPEDEVEKNTDEVVEIPFFVFFYCYCLVIIITGLFLDSGLRAIEIGEIHVSENYFNTIIVKKYRSESCDNQ